MVMNILYPVLCAGHCSRISEGNREESSLFSAEVDFLVQGERKETIDMPYVNECYDEK